MNNLPETSASLLLQVTDPSNHQAWLRFSEIYRPVIFRAAVARGLQHADAEELAQTVLVKVADKIESWRRERKANQRFLPWLLTIARNAAINQLSRRPFDIATGGSSDDWQLSLQHKTSDSSVELDLQYRRQLFRMAADVVKQQVSQETWHAFWITSVEGVAIADAANQLKCGQGTIYAARSRVMRRLQTFVKTWGKQQSE